MVQLHSNSYITDNKADYVNVVISFPDMAQSRGPRA